MTVRELVARLSAHADEAEVRIFDDWGSGYVLRPVSNVIDTSEFEAEAESPAVVLCYDLEGGA